MMRSVFGRVFSIILLVLVISFTITGVLMDFGLHDFVADQKTTQLSRTADRVVEALDQYMKSLGTTPNTQLFDLLTRLLAENTESLIWIVSNDGVILMASEIPEAVLKKMTITPEGLPRLTDPRQFELASRKVYKEGDFFGLFENTGTRWVTASLPFTITDIQPYSRTFSGIVLIHAQTPSLYATKNTILLAFIISGIIGATIALVLVTVLSKRLVKPLNQMKWAAKRVAAGEFTERIAIKGKDEIAELSDSFNEMVVALENLEHMRRDFISNVSHELRTPMTTIKGFVEGILDGVIPEERQPYYLVIVRDEVNRMQTLVNDLLDLAKMQAGEIRFKMADFDINELVRRCVISLQQMFIEKELEFRADFETERMFVFGDKDAIQRVILNLLHNAIKFTQQNGKITIKTYMEKDKGVFVIEDTGKGIAKDELPYIFERFYKTDKSRSLDKTGVGLGLAIVRNIIISHNETIKVESQEGHGTRFIFTLRSAQSPEEY